MAPSGNCISFFPPRFTIRNGTWSVTVSGMGAPRVPCCGLDAAGQHLAREAAEPVDAEPNVQPVRAYLHPFNQQRHDAGLLCGEEFVPQRV